MPWNNQNEVTHNRVFLIVLHWARVECDYLLVPTNLVQLLSYFCVVPVATKEFTIEGFMNARTAFSRDWKEHYFCLQNSLFLMAATPKTKSLDNAACMCMEGATVHASESDGLCFSVTRISKRTKKTIIVCFRTKTPSDTQQWLTCLKKASRLTIRDIYHFQYSLGFNVVAAVCRTTAKKYAIKIVDTKRRFFQEQMFRKDLAVLKTLKSPYLVQMYDTFVTKKTIHVIMEKCEGGEALNAIAAMDGDLYSEALCCGIMHQVASGVAHFHDNGILLRDLRPANVLCVKRHCLDEIKLAGFGVSKYVADFFDTAPNFAVRYLAPEVLAAKTYGHEVDFWSVGVMMYLLLCGYAISDDALRSPLVVRGDIEFLDKDWAHVSPLIVEMVKGLLQKDPSKRTTVEELANATWKVVASGQSYARAHFKLKNYFYARKCIERTAEC